MKWFPVFANMMLMFSGVSLQAQVAEPEKVKHDSDFLRIEENGDATMLQTGIVRYQKGEETVDLIGAIHIADDVYYKALNEKFTHYDKLLFEMVTQVPPRKKGEVQETEEERKEAKKVNEDALKQSPLNGLGGMYKMVADVLDLKDQPKSIDYTAANFVHADLSMKEFTKLQKEHKESIGAVMNKVQEGRSAEAIRAQNELEKSLVNDFMTGRINDLKCKLMKHMMYGVSSLTNLSDSVIIGKRNDQCMRVLDRELAGGAKRVGIFYGAAHFHDMEKKLELRGFRKVGVEWMAAWTVKKEGEKVAPKGGGSDKVVPEKPAESGGKAAA